MQPKASGIWQGEDRIKLLVDVVMLIHFGPFLVFPLRRERLKL